MPLKRRKLIGTLRGKFGFEDDRSTAHPYLALWLDGRKQVIVAMPNPHSRTDLIGDDLLRRIARKCRVTLGYFNGMIDCQHDRDAYYGRLRSGDSC